MFLIDNPNHRYKQYTYPRRGGGYTAPQIVLHTYEAPYNRSLLAAATWLTTRTNPGSYHALAGARSTKDVLQLAPWSYETWHSVPSNNWAIGISAVAYAHQWKSLPPNVRENLVKSMAYAAANAAKWLQQHHGRVVQPRLLTRKQAMRKESGFVYHATMDPGRRTDPGKDFPWDMFIAEFNRLMRNDGGGSAPATKNEEWDEMATKKEVQDAIESGVTSVLRREFARDGRLTNEVWVHQNPARPGTDMRGYMVSNYEAIVERTAALEAQVGGLVGALAAVNNGEAFDEDKLLKGVSDAAHAAATKGVADAIKSIETTVTIERDGEEG